MWKLLQRNVERILCGSFNDSSISLVWFNNYSKKYIYISFDLNNFSINKISRFITTCRYLFVVLYIYISRSSHHRMLQMHLTSMQCFFPGVFPFFGPKFSCVFDVAFFFNFFFPFFFFFNINFRARSTSMRFSVVFQVTNFPSLQRFHFTLMNFQFLTNRWLIHGPLLRDWSTCSFPNNKILPNIERNGRFVFEKA